jgi:hypothetical protein
MEITELMHLLNRFHDEALIIYKELSDPTNSKTSDEILVLQKIIEGYSNAYNNLLSILLIMTQSNQTKFNFKENRKQLESFNNFFITK